MTRPIALFTVLLLFALPLSLLAGRVWVDPWSTPNAAVILAELRLPRAMLALVVGAGLGAAGAAMQAIYALPADPGCSHRSRSRAGRGCELLVRLRGSTWFWAVSLRRGGAGPLAAIAAARRPSPFSSPEISPASRSADELAITCTERFG